MLNYKNLTKKNYLLLFLAALILFVAYGFLGYSKKLNRKFFILKKPVATLAVKHSNKRLHVKRPVRAAFYNPADTMAYQSLAANISKVNMLIIDDLYIDPLTDSVCIKPGLLGGKLIEKSGVTSLALLTNFYGDHFNGASLHRILNDSVKTARLIAQILKSVQSNHFGGINIDFEELQETSGKPLVHFASALYKQMHPLGLTVTIDVIPFNDDYNTPELVKYNDLVFMMAYDQFNDTSAPGPVSSLSWIRNVLEQQTKKLPANKLILCIAGYGYDWPEFGNGKSVSYSEAIRIAAKNAAFIVLNDSTFNPSFTYTDARSVMHHVYFTSAKTNIAAMHLASRQHLAGVALWRLGTEDKRLWSFYNPQQPPPPIIFNDGDLNVGSNDYGYSTFGLGGNVDY